jgi:hypothetical protein
MVTCDLKSGAPRKKARLRAEGEPVKAVCNACAIEIARMRRDQTPFERTACTIFVHAAGALLRIGSMNPGCGSHTKS